MWCIFVADIISRPVAADSSVRNLHRAAPLWWCASGNDVRHDDAPGSDSQGSDSQGSDSQGSDSQGSDSQGSDSLGLQPPSPLSRGDFMSAPVAHAHHAPEGFIRKYVFSLDHKVIGTQYY